MVESKFIKDFPTYAINSDGTIQNIVTGRYLKYDITNSGYYRVTLSCNGITKRYQVHRLIAELFVNKKDEFRNIVNHKDLNKTNNHFKNLEWVTHKENAQHAAINDKYHCGEEHHNSKYSKETIAIIYTEYLLGMNRKDIIERYGVPKSLCDDVLYKRAWKHVTDEIDKTINK